MKQRVTLPIYNLSCGGGGALTVERALTKVPGAMRVYVNPATEMAYVEYDAEQVSLEQLAETIAQAGFGPPIVAPAYACPSASVTPAPGQLNVFRLALVGGLGLATLYTLAILALLVVPSLLTVAHAWLSLLGEADQGWAMLLGFGITFLSGALVAGVLAALGNHWPTPTNAPIHLDGLESKLRV
jgi:copper chaperone CopZ